ncbi:MAG: ribonuclease D [Alphaproteobacteria bacterium]|nr:ribonuclease D [Alphaproteobacteria bacterium]
MTDQNALDTFCADLVNQNPAFICIDTEFMRQHTYWPQLSLIQIATPEEAVIIDPLVHDLSLQPMAPFLQDEKITKVFHSGRQDIEIFWHLLGDTPKPIFDTQIAAGFLGMGDGIGYEKLIQEILGVALDKTNQFTDWLKRPLRPAQLDYALGDVVYLCQAYPILIDRLQQKGREGWVMAESASLQNAALYQPDEQQAWRRIKHHIKHWNHLFILKSLVGWRELEARRQNLNRGALIEDRALIDLAHRGFLEEGELEKPLTDYRQQITSLGLLESFFSSYKVAHDLIEGDDDSLIQNTTQAELKSLHPAPALPDVEKRIRTLRAGVQDAALTLGIPANYIANRHDIDSFASQPDSDHKLANGWRREVLQGNLSDDFFDLD